MIHLATVVTLCVRLCLGQKLQQMVGRFETTRLTNTVSRRSPAVGAGVIIVALNLLIGFGQQLNLPTTFIVLLSVDLRLGHELTQSSIGDDGNLAVRRVDRPHVEF
ncbi:hypothetical protein D3C75_923310 [compost metagenome]